MLSMCGCHFLQLRPFPVAMLSAYHTGRFGTPSEVVQFERITPEQEQGEICRNALMIVGRC